MSCFLQEVKKLCKRPIVWIAFLLLLLLAAADAPYYWLHGYRARHAYLNWLLMPNVGFSLYEYLFYAFCTACTGLVFAQERRTSFYTGCMLRQSRGSYFRAKIAAVFSVAFLGLLLPLLLNLLITFAIYPASAAAAAADSSYEIFVPAAGSLAMRFYQISPLVMAVFFCVMNALAAALLAVLTLGIQMIGRFRRPALAFLVPYVILYGLEFLCTYFLPSKYTLSMILQPLVSNHTDLLSAACWLLVFGALVLLDCIVLAIGFRRNREAL